MASDGPMMLPAAKSDHDATSIRWNDPAPIWLAVIGFVIVCGARLVADGARTTLLMATTHALAFAVCCYLAGMVLCTWFDAAERSQGLSSRHIVSARGALADWLLAGQRTGLRKAMRERFVIYWVVLLVCWTPWFAFCWPGVMRDDTIAQFMQSAGYHRYFTQHPLFDTLVFGLFWRFGGAIGNQVWGLVCFTVVQGLLMAANLALVLCYLRSRGVPRLAVGIGLFYGATCYAVVGSVTTMSKDSLNTVFMVPLALLAVEICLTRGAVLKRIWPCVALVALMVLAMISKRTVEAILPCVFIVLVCVASKARMRVVCCFLAAALLALGVWDPVSMRLTGARESVDRDVFGFVMLPIARIGSENPREITAQERHELDPVMNVDKAFRQYDDKRSDETSWTMNTEANASQKLTALKAWLRIGLRHPRAYLKTYATLDYAWYFPTGGIAFPADSAYLFGSRYMRQWGTFVTPPVTAERALHDFLNTIGPLPKWKIRVVKAIDRVIALPVFSYAVYITYLPLLMACYFISRRRWRHLAAWSPLGITVLSLYASPIVLCWYAMPVFHMLPLFVGLGFIATANYPLGQPDCNGHSTAFDGIAYRPSDSGSRDTLIVEAGEREGIYLADFPIDEIREYRSREVHGNAYRHPRKYKMLVSEGIKEPFIRADYRRD